MRKKTENRTCYLKASVTVETTLIMPLILSCIMLLIIMNGYLHDTVILNGIAAEVLYADEESDAEKLFYEEMEKRALWIKQVEVSENEDPLSTTISWETVYTLPLKNMLSAVTGEEEVELAGKVGKQSWSMAQIIRYVNQN